MKTLLAQTEYKGFIVNTYMEPEFESYTSINGNGKEEQEIERKIESGEYEHFFVSVQATKNDIILGEAQLGSLVYSEPKDFVKELHGYHEDLVCQAVEEAEENLKLLINGV